MRLHALVVLLLLLVAPAFQKEAAPDPRERPPPDARLEGAWALNDTRLRLPTLPAWSVSDECLLVESWGGSTVVAGLARATWRNASVGGADVMRVSVLVPGRMPLEAEGGSPIELRVDGMPLSGEEPTRIVLRSADAQAPLVRQGATLALRLDVVGGPVAAKVGSCEG